MQATVDSTFAMEGQPSAAPLKQAATDSVLRHAAVNFVLSLAGTGGAAMLVKTCAGPGSWAYGFFFERQFVQWIIVWMCIHGLVEVARRIPVWLRERRGLRAWQRGGTPAPDTGLVHERYQRLQQLLDCAPVVDIRAGARQLSEQAAAQLDSRYSTVNVLTHLASYCGFFGTVLGLSVGLFHAFGGTGGLSLKSFGAAVSTSFDTTLSGVACTILLIMVQSLVRSREETVLTATDQLADDALLRHEQETASALGVNGLAVSPQNYGELFRRAVEMISSQVREVAASSRDLGRHTQAMLETLGRTSNELHATGARLDGTIQSVESSRAEMKEGLALVARTTDEHARQIGVSMESSRNDLKANLTRMANAAENQNSQLATMVKQNEALAVRLNEVKDLAARPRKVQIVEQA